MDKYKDNLIIEYLTKEFTAILIMLFLLANHKIIDEKLAKILQAMVGFRNIAIHDYQKLDLSILQNIIEHNLINLKDFTKILISRYA